MNDALPPTDAAAEPPPKNLGRYQLRERLGAGAMGVVYAAYDPQLDRVVAIKLLHASGAAAAPLTARLRKEAQLMARLSHPHVVAVHDVGVVDDHLFVAMDFIEGSSLAQWLQSPRTAREILRAFALAGRGLAAAHAAGVVHRDFKPENVLVGANGQVRVTDFGLARAQPQPGAWSGIAGRPATADSLSQAGELVGSPAYMAPEQMGAPEASRPQEPVDARADQFSFCVALYEALYGARPFGGGDLQSLLAEIEARRLRPEPPGAKVPPPVRRALLRGLSARPADRFPSMDALLAALEPPRAARPLRIAGAGLLLALAGLLGYLHLQKSRAESACRSAGLKLQHVWDPQLREQARTAFLATHLPFAETAWSNAERALDDYAAKWTAMRIDACEATSVRHQQPADLLDLRMACLDDRLRDLSAVSSLLAAADPAVVGKAADIASGLRGLSLCADERRLRSPRAPTAEQIPKLNPLWRKLAQSRVLANAGKIKEASQLLQELSGEARALGYPPLEADTLVSLGMFQFQAGDLPSAQQSLTRAAAAGMAANAYNVVADAWILLIPVDMFLGQLDAAANAGVQAQAAVDRLPAEDERRAQLADELSGLYRQTNKFAEARAQAEKAVALAPEKTVFEVNALMELAETLEMTGENPQGLVVASRALKLVRELYGSEHPLSAEHEQMVGVLEAELGDRASARAHYLHAAAVLERALGPDHLAVASALRSVADSMTASDPKQGLVYAQRSLAICEKAPESQELVNSLAQVGTEELALDHPQAALGMFQRALVVALRVSADPDDLEAAAVRGSLAEVYTAQGKLKLAREMILASLGVEQRVYGPAHPATAAGLFDLGKLELAEKHYALAHRWVEQSIGPARNQGKDTPDSLERELLLAEIELREDPAAAAARLERIAALPDDAPGKDPLFDRERARFLLARALWAERKEPPRAQQLAAQARDGYAARGEKAAKQREEVETWLANTARLSSR